jgi:curved DNA-binding protein CbpA
MERPLRFDHYKVLGVPRDAGAAEIKRAYRRLVKRCHPDALRSNDAAGIFHVVQEAYETLMDPLLRRRYDERLRHYRPPSRPAGEPAAHPSSRRSAGTGWAWRNVDRRPPARWQRMAFKGLHITGLLFGSSLLLCLLVGISLNHMPLWYMVVGAPGLMAIPASLSGLRGGDR